MQAKRVCHRGSESKGAAEPGAGAVADRVCARVGRESRRSHCPQRGKLSEAVAERGGERKERREGATGVRYTRNS